jgi:hypothetical protein
MSFLPSISTKPYQQPYRPPTGDFCHRHLTSSSAQHHMSLQKQCKDMDDTMVT